MSDRLHELDPSHAVFTAMSSFWWRLLAIFGCFWLGHYVGWNASDAGELLRSIWNDGLIAAFNQSHLNPISVPLGWFGALLLGCEGIGGVGYLFVVATAFLIVRLSEDHYLHGFAMALLLQPIDTFLVFGPNLSVDAFNTTIALIVLFTWEVVVGGLDWWSLRRMRQEEAG